MVKEISIPQSIRFQERILELAKRKAKYLGMKLPAYIQQLIVKDTKDGIPDGQ